MVNWQDKYKDYYSGETENIISTKELINKAIMLNPGIESEVIKSLIEVKAIREQTNAIKNNSKSSDFLAKVGIFVGVVGTIATIFGAYYGYLALR